MRLRAYNAAKYVCGQGSVPDPSYLVSRGRIRGAEGKGVKGKKEEEGRGPEPGKSRGQEEKGKEGEGQGEGQGMGRGGKLKQGRRLAKAGPV